MLKTTSSIALFGLILSLSASDATAQSGDYYLTNSDIELRAGITIPFGTTGQTKKEKPQFQLSMRNYKATTDESYSWALSRAEERKFYESKFAVTLEDQPAFLINDQRLILDDEQMNLSTTEKVLIGGAVVLGLMAVSYIIDCKDDPFC